MLVDRVEKGSVFFRFLHDINTVHEDSEDGWKSQIGKTLIPIHDLLKIKVLEKLFTIWRDVDQTQFLLEMAAHPGDLNNRLAWAEKCLKEFDDNPMKGF